MNCEYFRLESCAYYKIGAPLAAWLGGRAIAPDMPPPTARKDDDEPVPALDEETFDWPPPDEVIKKMRVYDFATTETRPLEAEPPRESNSEIASTSGRAPRTAAIRPPRAWPLRHLSVRARLVFGVVALLVIGAGGFGAWKLLRQGSPIRPVAPPTAQTTRTPEPLIPPSATATPAPATPAPGNPATDQQAAAQTQSTAGAASSVLVRTDTAGARVWIDGVYRGRTPLNAADLQPGTHAVSVEAPAGRIQQTISLTPGSTATVFVTTGAAVSGGIAVTAPAELEVRESGRVVGTSRAERILLDPGRHTLDLVNDALGYTSRQVVDVVPGKIVPIAVQFPNGTLNINALPWAEVFVDGERIGETPIGNLSVRVGSHEITFRHPDLGEVKRTVEVTLRGPARISVNLEKKEP